MLNMRRLERQQHLLLELRSKAARGYGQTAQQGIPEDESWLQAAVKEIKAHEKPCITFQETSWGYRIKRGRQTK